MKTRLHIDRFVLRTHGLTPAAAEATARAIGPALAGQLNDQPRPGGLVPVLTVKLPASAAQSPAQIARAVATRLSIESSG